MRTIRTPRRGSRRFQGALLACAAVVVAGGWSILRPESERAVDVLERPESAAVSRGESGVSVSDSVDLPQTSFAARIQRDVVRGKIEQSADAETVRRARWEEAFPWKPNYSSEMAFDEEIFRSSFSEDEPPERSRTNTEFKIAENQSVLSGFFNDELRFSPQFEKFYEILEEHDRGHDPAQAAITFRGLRKYVQALSDGEDADRWHENLRAVLESWTWFRPEFQSAEGDLATRQLIDRLVAEVPGMENLPLDAMSYPDIATGSPEYLALAEGDEQLLVPYPGWVEQADAYWERRLGSNQGIFSRMDEVLEAMVSEYGAAADLGPEAFAKEVESSAGAATARLLLGVDG